MTKKEEPRPMFPVKHEFYASLDRFIHEAGMLADSLRTVLRHADGIKPGIATLLQERLDAFDHARTGRL